MTDIKSPSDFSPRRVVKGTLWAAIDNWTRQLIQLGTFVAVGNVLGPEIFGIMSVALLYVAIIQTTLWETFGQAVVRRVDAEPAHVEAAFWAVVSLGAIWTAASLPGGYLVGYLFDEPRVIEIVWILSLTFPLLGAANVLQNKLLRDLRVRALAIRSILAYGSASILAIVLVNNGYGIWSLVAFQATWPVLDFLILAIAARWLPRLSFSRVHYREISDYSYKCIGSSLINIAAMQIDRILVGIFIGPVALGLYSLAHRMVEGLSQAINGVMNTIALPTFAKLQTDRAQLQGAIKSATYAANLATFPAFVGLALVAPTLVEAFFEPEWKPVGFILQIMCIRFLVLPMGLFLTTCKRAIGRADLLLQLAILIAVMRGLFVTVAIVLELQIIGVVIAVTLVPYIVLPLRIYMIKRLVALDTLNYLRILIPPSCAVLFMSICVILVRYALEGTVSPSLILLSMVATGILSYALAVMVVARSFLREMIVRLRIPDQHASASAK